MLYQIKDGTVSAGGQTILSHIDFYIKEKEKIAVVGKNGAGKTTLLRLLAGEMQLDRDDHRGMSSGAHGKETACKNSLGIVTSRNITIGMLRQVDSSNQDKTIEEILLESCPDRDTYSKERFDYEMEYDRLFTGFGFEKEEKSRTLGSFSGGEQTKISLIKLLLEKPDLLLLDEPTNHLDMKTVEWLEDYLINYPKAVVIVSHDRAFLDAVATGVYELENGALHRYAGNYTQYRQQKLKNLQIQRKAYERQQAEIAKLQDFVARNKARVATRNMAMSRQKKLDKMDVIELAAEKPKPEFSFKEGRTTGRIIFETKDLIIGYDEPLSKPLNLSMERGEKVALIGANGIGKTTLLKSILGLIPPLSGEVEQGDYLEIGYFEQEMSGSGDNSCIEEIWQEFPAFTQYEVRSALARCGLTTKHIESRVKVLSGGEQAKVRLCKLMNRATNVLLLDEPTNHLDMDAKDELKRALKEYKGSILMVCHEPEFYDGLATQVWDLSQWTTKL